MNPCETYDLMSNHVPRAVENARQCEFIMNIYFEKELECDLVSISNMIQ
jgi:ubiquinone biosynthesis protein Coq4